RALLAGEGAHHIGAVRIPGQRNRALLQLGGTGKVEEGRQEGSLRHLALVHHLRHERRGRRLVLRAGDREADVGGAEIDAEARTAHATSTSAGATMVASKPGATSGSLTSTAFHPGCAKIPR